MISRLLFVAILCLIAVATGCSEGMLWKTGQYSPWAQEKWTEEEKITDTLFEKKRELDQLVAHANEGSEQAKKDAAEKLRNSVVREPILLVKLHAIQLLSDLPTAESVETLMLASRDPDSRIRKAAIDSWQRMQNTEAIAQLQEIIGADTDVDVRLHATRALGSFTDQKAASALSMALTDTNPAVQFRATQSLAKITGQKFGADVSAWQEFLGEQTTEQAKSPTGSTFR